MIGLDTNVLVRYFADDDRVQSPRAAKLMESLTTQAPGYVCVIALVEAVWVMESRYGATRAEIADIVTQLLNAQTIVVENAACVSLGLNRYKTGRADFEDCLISANGEIAGARATMTFDKLAARDAGMTLI